MAKVANTGCCWKKKIIQITEVYHTEIRLHHSSCDDPSTQGASVPKNCNT